MRPDVYGRIAGRASTQLGLITSEQLTALGVTRHERAGLIRSGGWERRHRRVLADRAAPRTDEQRVLAAALDVPGSVVTSTTAAWIANVRGYGPEPIHLVVRRGGHHRAPAGVVLHETFWLPRSHRKVTRQIPTVTDARLCFELASVVHPKRLRRVVDRLHSDRGMAYGDMARVAAELWRRGKPGSAEMRLVVDERMPGYVPPASELEAVFRDLCDSAGIPQPVRQLDVGGDAWVGRVDVAFPAHKLLVELDSRRWHDTATAFDDDRARTNALVRAGWRVVRITWRMLHDDPAGVVALLWSCLGGASAA